MTDQSPGKESKKGVTAGIVIAVLVAICAFIACLTTSIYFIVRNGDSSVAGNRPDTQTTAPESVLVPGPPEGWEWDYSDEFTTGDNWTIKSSTSDYGIIDMYVEDGRYKWDMQSVDDFFWWSWYEGSENHDDFYYSVTARQVSGDDSKTTYGLVYRWAYDDLYYIFLISDDGHYSVQLNDGSWHNIIDWTYTETIKPYEDNKLAVMADGPNMSFTINDYLVGEAVDDSIELGSLGLFMELTEGGENALVEFDDVSVYVP